MSHFKNIVAASAFLASGFAAVQADVGVLDKYECHKHQQTNKYHCHGPADLAKLGGFVLGADTRTLVWGSSSGSVAFLGAAINAEYNHRWLAATANYYYKVSVTKVENNDIFVDQGMTLDGFQLGLKAGPGVGRKGSKYYATAGWNISNIADDAAPALNRAINGYYVGAGFGFNTNTLVFDVLATYHDATDVNEYLASRDFTADATVVDARVSLGWRF